jgi:hypothetical protein
MRRDSLTEKTAEELINRLVGDYQCESGSDEEDDEAEEAQGGDDDGDGGSDGKYSTRSAGQGGEDDDGWYRRRMVSVRGIDEGSARGGISSGALCQKLHKITSASTKSA